MNCSNIIEMLLYDIINDNMSWNKSRFLIKIFNIIEHNLIEKHHHVFQLSMIT